MGDSIEKTILAEVEKRLVGMFAPGVIVEKIDPDTEVEALLTKANATTDPDLAAAYRALAREAMEQ